MYEAQIREYLAAFHIPKDYRERILEYHRKLESAYGDAEKHRAVLERRLKRLRELYEWGDYTRAEYETRKQDIVRQLEALAPKLAETDHLDRLDQSLADVPAGWDAGTQEQRNKLARALVDEVWVKDNTVVGVKPRPELEPFFRLNYEEFVKENIERSGSSSQRLSGGSPGPPLRAPPLEPRVRSPDASGRRNSEGVPQRDISGGGGRGVRLCCLFSWE